jgi:hypothetical protein
MMELELMLAFSLLNRPQLLPKAHSGSEIPSTINWNMQKSARASTVVHNTDLFGLVAFVFFVVAVNDRGEIQKVPNPFA